MSEEPSAKRSDVIFLKPFNEDLREALKSESQSLRCSLTRYIERVLASMGPRKRAEAYSESVRLESALLTKRVIASAKADLEKNRAAAS